MMTILILIVKIITQIMIIMIIIITIILMIINKKAMKGFKLRSGGRENESYNFTSGK